MDDEESGMDELGNFLSAHTRELFESSDDDSAIGWFKFDHHTAPLGLFGGDSSCAGASERVIYNVTDVRRIEDETAQDGNGLLRWVEGTLLALWVDDHALILGFHECMDSMPPVGDAFMLRRVVEPSDHRGGLEPEKELSELPARCLHSIPKGKQHFVRAENIGSVLATQTRTHSLQPRVRKCSELLIALQMIIRNRGVRTFALGESLPAFYVGHAIGHVCEDQGNAVLADHAINKVWITTVTASNQVIADSEDVALFDR